MDTRSKIQILEAIATGQLHTIARMVPPTYAKRFKSPADLAEVVQRIYGQASRMIRGKDGYYVIGCVTEPLWWFYNSGDGKYTDWMYNKGEPLEFTESEYRQIIKEMEFRPGVWHEEKTYEDKVITFKRATDESIINPEGTTEGPAGDQAEI